jgi:hypothetical protein
MQLARHFFMAGKPADKAATCRHAILAEKLSDRGGIRAEDIRSE